jgi:hypothetical protein
MVSTARDVTVDARFTEKQVSLAKRYELYTPEQLLTHLDQERADLDQRIASNRDRIVGLKETCEQLVHMMDGMSDEILSLLRSIDKVSRLPEDGMGAWNGKSFIRLTMHTPDETERQVTLRALLTEIVDSRRASSRTALDTDAASLVRLIADRLVCDKLIRVRILKPTVVRTETYEDVEMLRHYSGGEGVTVAILMYLTIVQMRAQHQHSTRRLQDAGFLLLDNPFGKCNREDLVRMHVHLAQQLRVQLIVMTGIRDPIILLSYPRRLWGTWFTVSPAWIYGIQWLPSAPWMAYLDRDRGFIKKAYDDMNREFDAQEEKEAAKKPGYAKKRAEIKSHGGELGSYHLGFVMQADPQWAVEQLDKLWAEPGDKVAHNMWMANIYYEASALRDLDRADFTSHGTSPTSMVFANDATKKRTFIAWNPTAKPQSVTFYGGAKPLTKLEVPAHSMASTSLPSR